AGPPAPALGPALHPRGPARRRRPVGDRRRGGRVRLRLRRHPGPRLAAARGRQPPAHRRHAGRPVLPDADGPRPPRGGRRRRTGCATQTGLSGPPVSAGLSPGPLPSPFSSRAWSPPLRSASFLTAVFAVSGGLLLADVAQAQSNARLSWPGRPEAA